MGDTWGLQSLKKKKKKGKKGQYQITEDFSVFHLKPFDLLTKIVALKQANKLFISQGNVMLDKGWIKPCVLYSRKPKGPVLKGDELCYPKIRCSNHALLFLSVGIRCICSLRFLRLKLGMSWCPVLLLLLPTEGSTGISKDFSPAWLQEMFLKTSWFLPWTKVLIKGRTSCCEKEHRNKLQSEGAAGWAADGQAALCVQFQTAIITPQHFCCWISFCQGALVTCIIN